MPLELRPFGKDQAAEAAVLTADSFISNPFRQVLFPDGRSGESTTQVITQEYTQLADDPDSYLIQIWDTDANRMAGFAVWQFTKSMTEEQWDERLKQRLRMYSDAKHEILDPFIRMENAVKRKIMGSGRWWELDYLNVHPEYQRKGLGGRLMEWGEEEFTKRDVPSVIAATEAGFGLYLKHGYEERQRYYVDLGKFGGEGRYFNAVLTKFPS